MTAGNTNNYNVFFRRLLFLGVLITLGLILFKELDFFIGAFLGALAGYVVLRKLQFRLVEKHHWRPWISSLALILILTALLLSTGFLVFEVIISELTNVNTEELSAGFNELPEKINAILGFKVFSDNAVNEVSGFLKKLASGLMNSTYSFAVNIFMMLVILYFMLARGRQMERRIVAYIPFKGENLELLEHELNNMIYSNVVVIPLAMFAQGIAAALVYWAFGVVNPIFWAFITALCGLIPMIGTVIISAPLGGYLIATGNPAEGIMVIVCGLVIIANMDNLLRIVFLGKVANTPPLVVIFGVILGIPLFGFWGIIFGPLMISGFLLLIKIYYVEYGLLSREEARCRPEEDTHPGQKSLHKALTRISGKK